MPLALETKDGDTGATRGSECVDKVWDEQVDGAWAPGKAPVSLLTTFLRCIQERESVEAERAAQKILEVEPNNRLVQDLLDAMKEHDAMEAAVEEEEESGDDEEESDDEEDNGEDGSEEDEEEDDDDDEDEDSNSTEAQEYDADAKNNGVE